MVAIDMKDRVRKQVRQSIGTKGMGVLEIRHILIVKVWDVVENSLVDLIFSPISRGVFDEDD